MYQLRTISSEEKHKVEKTFKAFLKFIKHKQYYQTCQSYQLSGILILMNTINLCPKDSLCNLVHIWKQKLYKSQDKYYSYKYLHTEKHKIPIYVDTNMTYGVLNQRQTH